MLYQRYWARFTYRYTKLYYYGESKVLQYFGNKRHNSAAPVSFVEDIKVTSTVDCEMPGLPDALQWLLASSASVAWSTDSVLSLFDLGWSWRFLRPERTVINCVPTFHKTKVFSYFCGVMVGFELIRHKFPNLTPLHVHLYVFQITHGVNQCRTSEHT